MSAATVLREGWIVLRGQEPGHQGFTSVGLGRKVAAGEIVQAVDHEGGRHVLIPVEGSLTPEDRLSAGVQVARLELGGNEQVYADVRCTLDRLADLFDDVAGDMVDAAVAEPLEPVAAAIRALDQWRSLLRNVRGARPSRVQIVGLLAELLVLRGIIARDPERRIDLWVGREGQRHDLRRDLTAIEVKGTIATEGRRIGVHGIRQLEEPEGGDLYLAWVRLEHVPGGSISLSGLIDEIRAMGVPAQMIHAGLDERGLPPGTWPEEQFELHEMRYYRVDTAFPRLVPAELIAGSPSPGVSEVRYTVDLDQAPEPLGDQEVDELERKIAEASG